MLHSVDVVVYAKLMIELVVHGISPLDHRRYRCAALARNSVP
jgi:hypothetical protein